MESEKNYSFSNKIIQLRKEKGFSQEQLADLLRVSRQAVSKWEASTALPALDKIIQLADLFGVSVDYLVRENALNETQNRTVVTTLDDTAVMTQLNEIKELVKPYHGREFKSKTTVFGIPLVHIRFDSRKRLAPAKGIIAIGNVAIGVVSIGAISIGVLSFGAVCIGLLAAFGAAALGCFAFGASAAGWMSFGGIVLGVHAFGGIAVAKELAIGGIANGNLAIGAVSEGAHTIDALTATKEQIQAAILEYYPNIPEFLRNILSSIKVN